MNTQNKFDNPCGCWHCYKRTQTASGNAPKLIEDHERTEDARIEARLDAVYDREEQEAE